MTSQRLYELDGIEDREEAIDWILRNQLGCRNLTPDQASFLRGKRYNREKDSHGGDRSDKETSGQNVHLKTAERLATEYKVDEKTIRRDGQYAAAVDTLAANAGEEIKQKILTREAPLRRALGAEIERRGEALKRV